MNVLQSIADTRDDRAQREIEADDRWLRERAGIDPEERRTSFNRWLKGTILKLLVMPEDAAAREKLLGKCAAEVTVMVRQLRGRGWLLDGKALAEEVTAAVAPIGAYQRAGKVDDLYPYLLTAMRRYVGTHAEELHAKALRTGSHEGTQSLGALMSGLGLDRIGKDRPVSMPEIVTAHVAGKVAAAAKRGRPKKIKTDETLPLL
ncbi:MAG: hypothetical protein H7067_14815 [Burkholderiales bacterium]|nr:hypothetical protein [Opitutaceae bacterium]